MVESLPTDFVVGAFGYCREGSRLRPAGGRADRNLGCLPGLRVCRCSTACPSADPLDIGGRFDSQFTRISTLLCLAPAHCAALSALRPGDYARSTILFVVWSSRICNGSQRYFCSCSGLVLGFTYRRQERWTNYSPISILQLGMGFLASKTVLSAIEMGLFTELANHSQSLETLQGRLGLHRRSARDFLDTLVALETFWNAATAHTPTRRLPSSSWTSANRPTSAASWRWRTTGSIHSGANSRRRCAPALPFRNQGWRPRPFRGSVCRSSASKRFPARHDGREPWSQHGHRPQVPLAPISNCCRCRDRPR